MKGIDVADLLDTSRRIFCTSLFRSPPLHACSRRTSGHRRLDRPPQSCLKQIKTEMLLIGLCLRIKLVGVISILLMKLLLNNFRACIWFRSQMYRRQTYKGTSLRTSLQSCIFHPDWEQVGECLGRTPLDGDIQLYICPHPGNVYRPGEKKQSDSQNIFFCVPKKTASHTFLWSKNN